MACGLARARRLHAPGTAPALHKDGIVHPAHPYCPGGRTAPLLPAPRRPTVRLCDSESHYRAACKAVCGSDPSLHQAGQCSAANRCSYPSREPIYWNQNRRTYHGRESCRVKSTRHPPPVAKARFRRPWRPYNEKTDAYCGLPCPQCARYASITCFLDAPTEAFPVALFWVDNLTSRTTPPAQRPAMDIFPTASETPRDIVDSQGIIVHKQLS